jgi:NADH dehydrogenase/NADH:ubiquinone oxidoreductase subunit G
MSAAGRAPVAFGWSVHTGWAVLVAVSGPPAAPAVVDRRRIEMMPHRDAKRPRFVYHAAQKLKRDAAERLVRDSAQMSWTNAKAALKAAVDELGAQGREVVASGIIVGNKRLTAPLEAILDSHALIHAAEGQLFRDAIRRASESLALPVTEIAAREIDTRAAEALRLSQAALAARVARIGAAAGRPWAKDHRQACLAALVALSATT